MESYAAVRRRPPQVTVAVGPGPYVEDVLAALAAQGVLHRVIRSWPEFTVDGYDTITGRWRRLFALPLYAHLVRIVWAAWRRLPRLRRYRTPQTLLFAIFDRLAARQLGHPDLLLGWSQVSLHSMRAARRRGAVTALEHPMLHVAAWQETMVEEYARFAPDAREYYSLFPRALVRRMLTEYEEADYVVVPSTVARDSFANRGFPLNRIVEVPFGVEVGFFVVPGKQPGARFRVAFVGRLELLKGVHYLLDAWQALALDDATLTCVGPVLPEIRGVLHRRANAGNVEILGHLPRNRVRDVLAESHVVVFPSLCDAFGLVILEAMASGRPVIATSRSGGPDIIEDGIDGFVVPPRDPAALAERLAWLFERREECAEMGRRARLKIEAKYSLAHYGERLLGAYSGMTEPRTTRDPDTSVWDVKA